MATYLIGDIQGCFDDLQALLKKVRFNPAYDSIWFTGDLVNRGPKSLETLRFVRDLGKRAVTVLGNHDLHLLSASVNCSRLRKKDSLTDILDAHDAAELLSWLRHRPLVHVSNGFCLVHAGIHPRWNISKAERLSREVESILRSAKHGNFFEHMYGDAPSLWSDLLRGWERLRFITNCFTRMRFIDSKGRLELRQKGAPGSQPDSYLPWFEFPLRKHKSHTILFGHWSTLGLYKRPGLIAVDTGCLWGGSLTAIRLDNGPDYAESKVKCGCG